MTDTLTPPPYEIEAKAREIYLDKYGAIGGRWELVETKDVWRKMARECLGITEPCDHVPKRAALDDTIGCIRCGEWLGKAN